MQVIRLLQVAAIAMCVIAGSASAQWTRVAQCQSEVRSVYFLDDVGLPDIGYAGTTDGVVWHTSDGGTSWQRVNAIPVAGQIVDFAFKDQFTGWLATKGGTSSGTTEIAFTTDGGVNWRALVTDDNYTGIHYNAKTNIVMFTDWTSSSSISKDDGATWMSFTAADYLDGFAFASDDLGLSFNAGSSAPHGFERTTDGGRTWTSVMNPGPGCWQGVAKPGTSTFFYLSEYTYGLYRTDDAGAMWQKVGSPTTASGGGVYLFTGCVRIDGCGNLYVQSTVNIATQGLYRSTDEGATWKSIGGPTANVDTRFAVGQHGVFATSVSGDIWRFTPTGSGSGVKLATQEYSCRTTACKQRDTLIIIKATSGCGASNDSVVSYDLSGPAFSFVTPPSVPNSVSADSLLFRYTPGPNASADTTILTIHVRRASDPDTVLTVTLIGNSDPVTVNRAVVLRPAGAESGLAGKAGATLTAEIRVSDVIDSGLLFDSLTFMLESGDDIASIDSVLAGNGWSLTTQVTAPSVVNCVLRRATVSDVTIDSVLARVFLRVYVNPASSTWLRMQNLRQFSHHNGRVCSVLSLTTSDSQRVTVLPGCGDSVLRRYMRGEDPIAIESVTPNPTESAVVCVLRSAQEQSVELTLVGESGIRYPRGSRTIQGSRSFRIDLTDLPAGQYLLRAVAGGAQVSTTVIKRR